MQHSRTDVRFPFATEHEYEKITIASSEHWIHRTVNDKINAGIGQRQPAGDLNLKNVLGGNGEIISKYEAFVLS